MIAMRGITIRAMAAVALLGCTSLNTGESITRNDGVDAAAGRGEGGNADVTLVDSSNGGYGGAGGATEKPDAKPGESSTEVPAEKIHPAVYHFGIVNHVFKFF